MLGRLNRRTKRFSKSEKMLKHALLMLFNKHSQATFLIFFFVFLVGNAHATSAQFSGELNPISDTGYYTLNWEPISQANLIELQQSRTPDFKESEMIYHGHNDSFFLSGLQNGAYYYRMKVDNNAWSDTLTLTVKHHSFQKAWLLFILGAVVFSSIVWVIIRGEQHAE